MPDYGAQNQVDIGQSTAPRIRQMCALLRRLKSGADCGVLGRGFDGILTQHCMRLQTFEYRSLQISKYVQQFFVSNNCPFQGPCAWALEPERNCIMLHQQICFRALERDFHPACFKCEVIKTISIYSIRPKNLVALSFGEKILCVFFFFSVLFVLLITNSRQLNIAGENNTKTNI